MQKAQSILDMLSKNVSEIKNTLTPERWDTLAGQIRQSASSFQNMADEKALVEKANQLLGLLIKDETVREILTRPAAGERGSSGQRHSLDRRDPPRVIRLETIANRFYLLCRQIDEVAETSLDEVVAQDSRDQAASWHGESRHD